MKNFKLLTMILALGLLFGACKKEEKDVREDYLGTYRVTEKEIGYYDVTYNMSITKSTANKNDIVITGLLGYPALAAIAQVTDNSFNIPLQNYDDYGYNGYGRKNGINITISIQLSQTGYAPRNLTLDCVKL